MLSITVVIISAALLLRGYAQIASGPLGVSDKNLKYLRKYQYLQESTDGSDVLLEIGDVTDAVKRLQEYGGIPITGEFDAATVALMEKPRCGVPDPVGKGESGVALGGRLKKRYAYTGGKWEKNDLVYRILNTAGSGLINQAQSYDAIERAFKVWSDLTPLRFTESTDGFADIYLKFGSYYHGDQYPFDGVGYTLAHAYPPMSGFSKDLDGDVHFDDSEPYTANTPDGINLFQVAAHEIGHSLGLAHSNDPRALMAPYYQGYVAEFRLPDDDRIGIQTLYGNPVGPDPGAPTKVPATQKPDADCNSLTFKAISVIRSELYAFKGDRYWRIRQPKELITSIKGDELKYFWSDLPADIDCAYERYDDQKIIFFKGNQYWEYNGLTVETGFPKPISELSPDLPVNIDAVLTYSRYKKTYFFKGDRVWRYDEGAKTLDQGWPYKIEEIFYGVPSNLGGAFRHGDGLVFIGPTDLKALLPQPYALRRATRTNLSMPSHALTELVSRTFSTDSYFVRGSQYYRYNEVTKGIDSGYPRSFGEDWLGCTPSHLHGNSASIKTPAVWGILLVTLQMVLNQL